MTPRSAQRSFRAVAAAHYTGEEDESSLDGLLAEVATIFPLPAGSRAADLAGLNSGQLADRLVEQALAVYQAREAEIGADKMRVLERLLMLRIIDGLWVEHLTMMEYMRQGIGLQAMAQRDPLVAYKREGHAQFQNLMSSIQHEVVHTIYHVKIQQQEEQNTEDKNDVLRFTGSNKACQIDQEVIPSYKYQCYNRSEYP